MTSVSRLLATLSLVALAASASVKPAAAQSAPAPKNPRLAKLKLRVQPKKLAPIVINKRSRSPRIDFLKRSTVRRSTGRGFHVIFHPASRFGAVQAFLQRTRAVHNMADIMNDWLRTPNVPVHVRECSKHPNPTVRKMAINAFYNRKSHSITFCYELAAHTLAVFKKEGNITNNVKLRAKVASVTSFVVLHEMTHALIHELGLPTVGREEDAADQLATLALMRFSTNGKQKVLDTAYRYELKAAQARHRHRKTGHSSYPFHDEHSMPAQREFNLKCLVFGSNVRGNMSLVRHGELPMKRARRCANEYRQINRGWNSLLARHIR